MRLAAARMRRHWRERSAVWRRDAGWLAIAALFFQIVLAGTHVPQDWNILSSLPICAAAAPDSAPPLDHRRPATHQDCPICRMAPIVSAALAPAAIALVPARAPLVQPLAAATGDGPGSEPASQAQPRAPPAEA